MSEHHDHSHAEVDHYNRYFSIGISLNFGFAFIEAVIGFYIGSLALVADAGHNFSDVFSLILAWVAHLLSLKASTERRTYGFKKTTILASLGSAILLLVALGGIIGEAVQRFTNPVQVESFPMIIVASIGVVINGLTAYLFVSGQKEDLNIRGAYLHMLADAGVSFSVVFGGIFIWYFHWTWIDPLLTIGIALTILAVTWQLLKDSIGLSLDFVPKHTDFAKIKSYLEALENVSDIHDLHIWGISTRETALTVHLVLKKQISNDPLLHQIQKYLHDEHHINHTTIQIEYQNQSHHSSFDAKCN